VGGAPADGVGILGAVDHDPLAEVQRVLAEMTFHFAPGGVGRRNRFVVFDEGPVGFGPHRIDHFAQHLEVTLRSVEHPDLAAVLEELAGARRRGRLLDELRVSKQVELVAGEVDGDDDADPRRTVGEALHCVVLLVAAAELPPVATRLRIDRIRRRGIAGG
jgi:hypothetical protein